MTSITITGIKWSSRNGRIVFSYMRLVYHPFSRRIIIADASYYDYYLIKDCVIKKYTTVADFIDDLPDERQRQVTALRTTIMTAHPDLEEHIKWNAPSYRFEGEDRITFNLHNPDAVRLILHCGATKKEDKSATPIIDDDSGMLEWNSNIRATITFTDLADITSKQIVLTSVIMRWLDLDLE